MLLGAVFITLAAGIVLAIVLTYLDPAPALIVLFFICIMGGIAFIVLLVGLTGFTANVVQFGMDQLHDSPGEDRTLFIHWYVWGYFVSVFITQFAWNFFMQELNGTIILPTFLVVAIPIIVTVLLVISVCLGHCRRRWFLIEPGSANPYKLVYRVSKFAYQHRIPIHRSAFTYCEDELPSGLDLGKDKYGGPFTTEEVEDVKAFYGILKVLFSFGMVLFLDFAANSLQPMFFDYHDSIAQSILLMNGLLSPLLVGVCIPIYLFLLRPFISYYIPGMLKRMGIGMCLVVLSLVISFSAETAYFINNGLCINTVYDDNATYSPPPLSFIYSILVVQNILSALSNMLTFIALLEFICSQSPHSMKGMLIGLWYAIKGLYQMLAAFLAVPYMFWSNPSPSCGFGYYLMNVLIGFFAIPVYVCVARRYKYRERDEPCLVRRYVEEYYSNLQQERYYDYD